MSMTWHDMLSFLKSRAGRRARSGIGSPGLSMRMATGNVCGRMYVASSWSAVLTSIMAESVGAWTRYVKAIARVFARIPENSMARYRIVHWKDIPSMVEAAEGDQTAQRQLSQRFQDLIDALAMRENATGEDAYLEGWGQGEWQERPGTPEEVAAAVAEELEASFQELLTKRFMPRFGS